MANRYQIKCINKPDRQSTVDHITHVGGYGTSAWKITVEDCMNRIENMGEQFFVQVGINSSDVRVIQATPYKRKHIRTTPDSTPTDNLLSLPECP